MRYCSQLCKNRHEPVYLQLLGYTWAPSGPSIEVEELAEACSFVLWRERCYGTGAVEIREPAPLSRLSESDARQALQSEPKLKLKDAQLPLFVVQQGDSGP